MRALPRHSRVANSNPKLEAPDELSLSGDLCPLQLAIRDELISLGVGVSKIQQYLHSGDLRNAEDTFANMMERLREKFCPANPAMCDWVREGRAGTGCDLLTASEPPYLHSISTRSPAKAEPEDSDTSGLNHLVEQAMRF